jgi:hypothetical protein
VDRGYTWAFAEPGPHQGRPRIVLDGREQRSTEAREIFFCQARLEMLFLVVLHYKIRGRPVQTRARPEPGPKFEARRV